MSKTSTKKAPVKKVRAAKTAKSAVLKKAAPKMSAKAPAKHAAKPGKSTKPAPAPAKSGFMWKLLEKKEAELKRRRLEQNTEGQFRDKDGNLHPREQSFAKFSGPRRRAV